MEFKDIDIPDILICKDTWAGKLKAMYTIVTSCAQFFLPLIIVIPCYIAIYVKLRNRPQVRHFSDLYNSY